MSRTFIRSLALVLALALVPGLSRPALADASLAQRLFADAEQAFQAKEYRRAAELFEEANRHSSHPSVLFNAAVSWDHAGELARAANDYRAALEDEGLSAAQTEESERRLAALAERLGYVHIAKPIDGLVTVAHLEREPIPARFYLNPGDYEVVLESTDGSRSTTSIDVEPGQTLKVTLDEPKAKAPLPPPTVVEPEPVFRDERPLPSPSRTQETLGWVSLGVGVVAAGVSAYLGTQALAAEETYLEQIDDRAPRATRANSRREAVDAQTRTNVGWVGAGVASGVGVVLLLTSPTFEF